MAKAKQKNNLLGEPSLFTGQFNHYALEDVDPVKKKKPLTLDYDNGFFSTLVSAYKTGVKQLAELKACEIEPSPADHKNAFQRAMKTIIASFRATFTDEKIKQNPTLGHFLEYLLTAYKTDLHELPDTPVNAHVIASEIVGRYRVKGNCLKEKEKGVSYDGAICHDITVALQAAEQRGFNRAKKELEK